jgi:TatD DNase family protein
VNNYWVDTHCHIYLSYKSDEERKTPERSSQILDRAEQAGVRRFVVVGIDVETSKTAISIASQDPRCKATVGLHPNSARSFSDPIKEALESLSARPEVTAIGETGLDFYRMGAPREIQEESFRFHIDLGRRTEKPVVIHVREAHEAVREILEDEAAHGPLPRLVMHCFSGSGEDAEAYLSFGAFLSFAGPITFRTANARGLREVAASVPLDRCLVETDSPYLSPHPFRGEPNEPARAVLIGRELASLKGVSEEELAEASTLAADGLFFGSSL